MGYYAFGNFWVCRKKITIYSLFGSPCIIVVTPNFQDILSLPLVIIACYAMYLTIVQLRSS